MKQLKFKPNIKIRDCGKKGSPVIAEFYNKEKANNFIENHPRPYDLVCDFEKEYLKKDTLSRGEE